MIKVKSKLNWINKIADNSKYYTNINEINNVINKQNKNDLNDKSQLCISNYEYKSDKNDSD